MQNRRTHPRLLCADFVDVRWTDKKGKVRRAISNLEDISVSGACLQLAEPVPVDTAIRFRFPQGELLGTVRHCVYRADGYFLGIEFSPGHRWSVRQFRPQHLTDLRMLVTRMPLKPPSIH